MRRQWIGAALICALVPVLVGCGTGEQTEPPDGARAAQAEELHGFYTRLATCMSDQGWPVQVNAEGDGINIDTTNTPASAADLDRVYDTCAASMGGPPPRPEPSSTVEIKALYGVYVETYECLVEHGHPVVEPPSEGVYVSTYEASLIGAGPAPWMAYGPEGNLKAMKEDCPEPTLANIGS